MKIKIREKEERVSFGDIRYEYSEHKEGEEAEKILDGLIDDFADELVLSHQVKGVVQIVITIDEEEQDWDWKIF